jgi:hypothetical protein
MDVRFGDGMRVPVTTISETSPLLVSAGAAAACVARPKAATPQIIDEASRRSRVLRIFKIYILQRSAGYGGAAPQGIDNPGPVSAPIKP